MESQTLAFVGLAPLLASLIAGVLIPNVVDFVTHSTAPWWIKSSLASVLAALAGAISTATLQGYQDWKIYLFNIFVAFVAVFSSHQAGSSQLVKSATADFGLFEQAPPVVVVPAVSSTPVLIDPLRLPEVPDDPKSLITYPKDF